MKVLFIFPYPHATAASQRFRFEQYLDILTENHISYTLAPFLDTGTWQILYKKGFIVKKSIGILTGFLRRIQLLFTVNRYDFVFIHREVSPLGPPLFEWIIAKMFRKKIIYDFDDAIWLPNTSANNRMAAQLKWHHKTASICKWSYRVSAGNAYLAEYARQFNGDVITNPTTIDTVRLHNQTKNQETDKLVIGWTGTHSTINYLYGLIPILRELGEKFDFTFLVISDKQPDFELDNLLYLPWSKASEMDDLLKMNIGIMPLTDDLWAKGKCGFKALQYMALGIPALVSPVGVNTEIVDDGLNGYICQNAGEWKSKLQKLLNDSVLRMEMGKAARQKVQQHYSVQANCRTFLDLFLTA